MARKHFLSDDGAPCWRCSRTCYGYAVDDAVTYVAAWCFKCGSDNMFYPKNKVGLDTHDFVAAEHRASYFGSAEAAKAVKS